MFAACIAAGSLIAKPVELAVGERFTDPIGFHDATPVFSWKLPEGVIEQRAYPVVARGDWKYLADEASEKEDPKVEVELTAEEQKLSRKERKALIKERSKATRQKPGPTAALHRFGEDIGEQSNLLAKNPEIVARLKQQMDVFHKELRENTRPAVVANQP